MDARLAAIINQLEKNLLSVEKAMANARAILRELAKEARSNGLPRVVKNAEKHFLLGQPRCDGNFPWAQRLPRENDDAD